MAVGDVYKTKDGKEKIRFESTGLGHVADFGPEQNYGWEHRRNNRRRYVVWTYATGWKPTRPPKSTP